MGTPTGPTANLGYGKPTEATIDQVNIWMRSTPWYQQQMKEWGQDPGHPNLSKSQSQQIVKMAQANGVVVDEGNMEVDDHGNFNPIGHKLRNTLIVAGIAGATIATMGAAGVFSAAAAPSAAGLTGVEATATAGLGTAALPGAMATLPALGTTAATSAISTAAATVGPEVAKAAAAKVAASGGAVTVQSILKTASDISKTGNSILSTVGQFGDALGANEKGRADGRVAQANANAQYDRTAADLYRATTEANTAKNTYNLNATNGQNTFDLSRGNLANSNAATDLSQRNFALAAPGKRAGNAVRGDILSQAHDVTVGGLAPGRTAVQFSGGLHPDMFSDSTRALGTNMTDQALSEQQAGDHFAPLPDLPDYVKPPAYTDGPPAPTPTAMPQPGATDSILNTAGTIGNLATLLSKLPYGQKKPQTPDVPYYEPNDQNGWG